MENPKKERCLIILKPDALQRNLVGEVISRIERTGLKITALKMIMATEEQCWNHYNKDEAWFKEKGQKVVDNKKERGETVDKEPREYGKDIVRALVEFMTASPVIPMVVEGNQAIGVLSKIIGGTEPLGSEVGTIRGDFTFDSFSLANKDNRAIRNLVHCSESVEEAEREIDLWFDPQEIIGYRLISERMLYDVNLDGLKE